MLTKHSEAVPRAAKVRGRQVMERPRNAVLTLPVIASKGQALLFSACQHPVPSSQVCHICGTAGSGCVHHRNLARTLQGFACCRGLRLVRGNLRSQGRHHLQHRTLAPTWTCAASPLRSCCIQ